MCVRIGWTRLTELYGAGAVERNVPAPEAPAQQAPVLLSVSDHLIAALEDNPESDMVDMLTMTPLKDPVVMCTGYVVDRSTFFVNGKMRFSRCPFTREPLSEAGTIPPYHFICSRDSTVVAAEAFLCVQCTPRCCFSGGSRTGKLAVSSWQPTWPRISWTRASMQRQHVSSTFARAMS